MFYYIKLMNGFIIWHWLKFADFFIVLIVFFFFLGTHPVSQDVSRVGHVDETLLNPRSNIIIGHATIASVGNLALR